jgi:hypothetical protein
MRICKDFVDFPATKCTMKTVSGILKTISCKSDFFNILGTQQKPYKTNIGDSVKTTAPQAFQRAKAASATTTATARAAPSTPSASKPVSISTKPRHGCGRHRMPCLYPSVPRY